MRLKTTCGDDIVCTVSKDKDPEALNVSVSEDRVSPEAVADQLKVHWQFDPDFRRHPPTERWTLTIGHVHTVDLFSFAPAEIGSAAVETILDALARFHGYLRDRTLWNLKTILVMAEDEPNGKTAGLKNGREVPAQQRFDIYPTVLHKTGSYRNKLHVDWLTGLCWHEAVHVCAERALQQLWEKHRRALGWCPVPFEFNIELPGGHIAHSVNFEPEHCPTDYATLQEDDDRAESVIAYLTGDRLHSLRRELVERVFEREARPSSTRLVRERPALPPLPRVHVVTYKPGLFRIVTTGPDAPVPPPRIHVTRDDYLAGVHSGKFSDPRLAIDEG